MPSSCDISVGIPGNCVGCAFDDVFVAVRADPNLVVVGFSAVGRLHDKLDAILDFDSLDADTNRVEIQFGSLFLALALRTIAARH